MLKHFSKFLLLLLGTTLLDHTEAGYHHHHHNNDGQDDDKMEMEAILVEEESLPAGLSPWELHVVNDLLMEVMLLKCPDVNRTIARGLKTFITSQVSKAPRVETMNPHFLPVYSNLVKCMDYIDERMKEVVPEEELKNVPKELKNVPEELKKTEPQTNSDVLVTFDVTSLAEQVTDDVRVPKENPTLASIDTNEEEVVEFHPVPKAHYAENPSDLILIIGIFDDVKSQNEQQREDEETNTVDENRSDIDESLRKAEEVRKSKARDEDSIEESTSSLISKIWNRTLDWFSSLGRKKRSVENGNKVHHKRKHNKKDEEENLQSRARKQVLHKYREVLETLAHLARRTCPPQHRPNHSFTTRAIEEIVYWLGKNFPTAQAAYEKYFKQGRMVLQVKNCLLNESFD